MGRIHCGKRRNCSLRAICPFPSVFKRLILQTRKNQGLFGKGLSNESTNCLICLATQKLDLMLVYFLLFIVTFSCPSEQRPKMTVSCYRGIVQGYRTKLPRVLPGSLTCSAYSTIAWDPGLQSYWKDN